MEVTFDPQSGQAYVSKQARPIENLEEPQEPLEQASQEEEPISYKTQPDGFTEPVDAPDELVEEEQEETVEDFSPLQQLAVNNLTSKGVDVEDALNWCEDETCPITDEQYDLLGSLMCDENQEVVELSMNVVAEAKANEELFTFSYDQEDVRSFTDTEQNELVDVVGPDYASQISNIAFNLANGTSSKADVFKYVADKPELQQAVLKAAKANLLSIYL